MMGLNYVHTRVIDAAEVLRQSSNDSLHIAFADHLVLVADALRMIQKVLDGDSSSGSEHEAIRECLTPSDEIDSARETALKAMEDLSNAINRSFENRAVVAVQNDKTAVSPDSAFTCNTCSLRFLCKGPSMWNGMACRGARSQILKEGA
jgi:hypothetical protein